MRVALPGFGHARAVATVRRALHVLRRLCAMRRVAQAMGGRRCGARAVARWREAALEAGWAREAMAMAREAHLELRRARRAAAVARCWVRLRWQAAARTLQAQRTAKACRVHGRLMLRWRRLQLAAGLLHWAAEARARRAFGDKCRRARRLQPLLFPQWVSWQAQQALARWAAEARRRLQRRRAVRRELAYLDELCCRLDDVGADACDAEAPSAEVGRLLALGVEVGAVQRLDAELGGPRAVRIMRAGCRQRGATLKHALQKMPPLKARGRYLEEVTLKIVDHLEEPNPADFAERYADVRERLRERTYSTALSVTLFA